MKLAIRITGFVLLVLVLSAAPSLQAQYMGQGQQNPPKPAQPGQTPQPAPPAMPATPPVNPEEENAFKVFAGLKPDDFAQQIQLGEEFLKKFPDSRYREMIYARLASAYLNTGQEDKMFVAGEKALELNPNDVDALALLAFTTPRRADPSSLDGDQKLTKAEKWGKQALALLETVQKPEGMTDEDFTKAKNEKLAMCHSGLGVGYYQRQKYADSVAELEQATKLSANPDSGDFYVLGRAYSQTKRYADAARAFGRCAEMDGPLQGSCKQDAERTRKLAATTLEPPKP